MNELFMKIDRMLRTTGYPAGQSELDARRRLAPGLSVGDYMRTLRAFDNIELIDGAWHYCPPKHEKQRLENLRLWVEASRRREEIIEVLKRENTILKAQLHKAIKVEFTDDPR